MSLLFVWVENLWGNKPGSAAPGEQVLRFIGIAGESKVRQNDRLNLPFKWKFTVAVWTECFQAWCPGAWSFVGAGSWVTPAVWKAYLWFLCCWRWNDAWLARTGTHPPTGPKRCKANFRFQKLHAVLLSPNDSVVSWSQSLFLSPPSPSPDCKPLLSRKP